MRSNFASLLILIISVGLIVIIHEFGHFATAQFFGVKTPVFSIGFGPALAKIEIKGTTFQIAALPLGGYVSMDMNQLNQKPYWQKMIIILAGIFNNIVLAFVALFFLFMLNRIIPLPIIKKILHKSPAEKVDLHPGDKIVALNHKKVSRLEDLMHMLQKIPGKEALLTIERDHSLLEVPVQLGSRNFIGANVAYLGVEFVEESKNKESFLNSLIKSVDATFNLLKVNAALLINLFKTVKTDSVIDLSTIMTKDIQKWFNFFLIFSAFTSIQIGLFNLLPIPLLDGGQAFEYTLQALLGNLLKPEAIAILHYLLIILFIMIIFYVARKKK